MVGRRRLMGRTLAFETWDVFTRQKFAGNPLAIVWDADGLSDEQMQRIAREFNYSETVFVCAPDSPSHIADLRIFTPMMELPFAGHPTVGAALALKKRSGDALDVMTLGEAAGPVSITFSTDGQSASFAPPQAPKVLRTMALEMEDVLMGSQPAEIVIASAGTPFAFCTMADAMAVDAAAPGPSLARFLEELNVVGLFVYAELSETEIYARMFCIDAAVAEDPATGSAVAALAAPLMQQSDKARSITVHQGVKLGRPSEIRLDCGPSAGEDSIHCRVGGPALPVMFGTLTLD